MKQRDPLNWTGKRSAPDAVEEGKEPEGDQPEHQDGDEGGEAPEAGGGDSPAAGGEAKTKKPAKVKK